MRTLRIGIVAITWCLLVHIPTAGAQGVDGCSLNCDASHAACVRAAGSSSDEATAKKQSDCGEHHVRCLQGCERMKQPDAGAQQPH
ncbi:MAG: hypothetical protein HYR72_09985 [Deltaproteobacteria bacterium]|nr:hypothetical protein [Deltaproteobacteria bacterium]MBI3388029.1 hypothetical protein [Deltaproteobacteria bacterium]